MTTPLFTPRDPGGMATGTGQPWVDLIHLVVLTKWLTSGCGSGRGVGSGHGARGTARWERGRCSGGAGREWIDLVDVSIQSAGVNKVPCSRPRGVNRGMGVG